MTVRTVIPMVDISMVNDLVNVDINMEMTNIPMGGI
jgi:hypothetical protein